MDMTHLPESPIRRITATALNVRISRPSRIQSSDISPIQRFRPQAFRPYCIRLTMPSTRAPVPRPMLNICR